jgi:hypothetical protein
MTSSILRSVRFAFVSLLLALTVYTVLESALGGGRTAVAQAAEGLATCGSAEHPCLLEPVAAVAARPAAKRMQLAEGLPTCGSESAPCVMAPLSIEVEPAEARLATSPPALGMTMRVRS